MLVRILRHRGVITGELVTAKLITAKLVGL
jgi:hypothetical protein